jgi:SAM-dependent methyltransferase
VILRPSSSPPLGDTFARDYGGKLELFSRFAEPELAVQIAALPVRMGAAVLDAGCGVGTVARLFAARVGAGGAVVALDLARAHTRRARATAPDAHAVVADLAALPFSPGTFDLIWSLNVVNHLPDPARGVAALAGLRRTGGTLVLALSHLLPEMIFAWDTGLERRVRDACHRYYRDKYGLAEDDMGAWRNLLGVAHEAGIEIGSVRTSVIERVPPLSAADRAYFQHAVFEGYWGPKLRPYLAPDDWSALAALCDPASDAYCLTRPDFHYVQTLTVAVAA